MHTVYLITNTINGRRYVGQTKTSLQRRFNGHQRKDRRCARYLHNAILKYGKENFIIEAIIDGLTEEMADEFEAEFIERYCTLVPNGYNLMSGGNVSRHSQETKELIRQIRTGTKASDEAKRKMSEARRGKGIRPPSSYAENWTSEARAKVSKRMMGLGNVNAKLTFEQVKEIRELYARGAASQSQLGRKFDVTQVSISSIVRNKTRKFQ